MHRTPSAENPCCQDPCNTNLGTREVPDACMTNARFQRVQHTAVYTYQVQYRNLIKKPLVLYDVVKKDPSSLGIQNQGFLHRVPAVCVLVQACSR